jgi:hypothetical protein
MASLKLEILAFKIPKSLMTAWSLLTLEFNLSKGIDAADIS